MMTTICSANMHHIIDIIKRKKRKKMFLLMKRTLRIYTLNLFSVHHTAVLTTVGTLYIHPQYLLILGKLILI